VRNRTGSENWFRRKPVGFW